MKKIINIIAIVMVALTGLSITACSDDALDTNPYNKSGVNILAFGPSPILRTEEIRITGTNMNKVDQVIFPGAAPVDKSAFNKVDNENIYVNVPDESVPGQIKLLAGKDTIKSEGTLTFEEPIEVTEVTPTTGLVAGDVITIKGDYVYNIASVTFTSGVEVLAEDFVSVSRREIQVAVPLEAESGPITFSDGDEWKEEYETPLEINTAKATAVTPRETDFGQEVTISGENFHVVSSVMFAGGVKGEITYQDKNTIKAIVPAECKPGAITLVTFSGITVTTEEISMPVISISNISQSDDIIEGDVITITGVNFDRVKGMNIPGHADFKDYKIEGNTLTFTVPEGFVDGDIVLIQNSNISVSVSVKVRKMSGIVWMGSVDMAGWGGNFPCFSWNDVFADMKAAMSGPGTLTLGISCYEADPMVKIAGSDWNTPVFENTPADAVLHPGADAKEVVITVTAADVARAFGDGFVIYGTGYILKYIKYELDGAGKVLNDTPIDICANGDWSATRIDGGYDWSDAQPGQSVFISAHRNPDVTDYNNFKVMDSWWSYQSDGLFFTEEGREDDETTTRVEAKTFEISLNADLINYFKNQGGLNAAGHGVIVDKVVLK